MLTRAKLLILAGMVTFAVAASVSPTIGAVTMTHHLRERIYYACMKGRLQLPLEKCGPTWTNVARYLSARVRHGPELTTGPACGDEASVYTDMFKHDFWGLGPPSDSGRSEVVVWDSTRTSISDSGGIGQDLNEAFWGISSSTIHDYWARNAAPVPGLQLIAGTSAVVVSPAFVDSLRQFGNKGGDVSGRFYQTYPRARGWIDVSRPGIDPARWQAMIEIGWTKAPLEGTGYLLFLRCDRGHWQLADTTLTWVS